MALTGGSAEEVVVPVGDTVPVTLAELIWARTHEGALDADDVLDRRTRIGLVPADRSAVLPVVNGLFAT
jgi:glycerol-3-phosphate dehydrogenase